MMTAMAATVGAGNIVGVTGTAPPFFLVSRHGYT
ncbi:MAG: hypothetical protein ABIU29_02205 [Chthoniobacterales bacterium]